MFAPVSNLVHHGVFIWSMGKGLFTRSRDDSQAATSPQSPHQQKLNKVNPEAFRIAFRQFNSLRNLSAKSSFCSSDSQSPSTTVYSFLYCRDGPCRTFQVSVLPLFISWVSWDSFSLLKGMFQFGKKKKTVMQQKVIHVIGRKTVIHLQASWPHILYF